MRPQSLPCDSHDKEPKIKFKRFVQFLNDNVQYTNQSTKTFKTLSITVLKMWHCFQNFSLTTTNLHYQLHFLLGTLHIIQYRKPPTISPGLIYFRKRFLMGLYKGGLIYGWAYTWTIFCVSNKQVRHKQVGHK